MIIFIIDESADYFLNLSANPYVYREKKVKKLLKAQCDILKLLVLSNRHSQTQRHKKDKGKKYYK